MKLYLNKKHIEGHVRMFRRMLLWKMCECKDKTRKHRKKQMLHKTQDNNIKNATYLPKH